MKKHVLSAEEEGILAKLSAVTHAPDTIFLHAKTTADMSFGEISGEDGESFELTHGNYIHAMESSDRNAQKKRF